MTCRYFDVRHDIDKLFARRTGMSQPPFRTGVQTRLKEFSRGLQAPQRTKLSDPGIGHTIAAKGTWTDGKTFVIDAPILGFGEQQRIILSFSGRKLTLRRTVAVGEGDEVSLDGEETE